MISSPGDGSKPHPSPARACKKFSKLLIMGHEWLGSRVTFSAWLKEHGLLQKDAARALGVSQPEVNRYCRSNFWPKKAVALRLLYFTGGAVTPMSGLTEDDVSEETIRSSKEFQAALALIEEVDKERKAREEIRKKNKRGRYNSYHSSSSAIRQPAVGEPTKDSERPGTLPDEGI